MANKRRKEARVREPSNEGTEALWWSIWATHVMNDSTITETAQAFSLSRVSVWRALAWCAQELSDGRATETTVEGLIYAKKHRLRQVRTQRATTIEDGNHQAAQGYLKEERELENEVGSLEGAILSKLAVQHTGAGGGPMLFEVVIGGAPTEGDDGTGTAAEDPDTV